MHVEKELYKIWVSRANRVTNLVSEENRKISVLSPGIRNTSGGPDFVEAIVMVGDKILTGDVEIHLNSSDWALHGHDNDKRYDNVILHVVLNNDGIPAVNTSGKTIPTLVLPQELITSVPAGGNRCKSIITEKTKTKKFVLELGLKRLRKKSLLFQNRFFSEFPDQVLYEGLCDSLGYSKNREPFRLLAKLLPIRLLYHIITKYSEKWETVLILEALYLGTAGFLSVGEEKIPNSNCPWKYHQYLKKLWIKLKRNYNLREIGFDRWDFSGVRPYNSPLFRLLAASRIISKFFPSSISQIIISKFASAQTGDEILKWIFSIFKQPAGLWKNHPCFGGKGPRNLVGNRRISDIAINIILPFVSAWGTYHGNEKMQKKATEIAKLVPTGNVPGHVRRLLQKVGFSGREVTNNLELQGWIEFHKSYCKKELCILCPLSEI